jgi:AGZA family xanthine/uracil permease-like MFS transporter
MLDRYFRITENGSTIRTEIVAGITTFLTMAYIIVVNPAILADAGMDRDSVFMATCLAAAFGSAMMGLYANYPVALAPGMGLNAYFTYAVVKGMNYPWQVALGAVFLSGAIFLILSVLPIRELIINAIPRSLKMAISAGIGFFLGLIALKNAGVVVDHPATLLTLGNLGAPGTLLAVVGFVALVALERYRVPGAIIIAVLAATFLGVVLGVSEFQGVASAPPSIAPTFLAMDLAGALKIGLVAIVFAFLFVDLFDNSGTLIAVAHRAGLLDEEGRLPRIGRALIADSSAAMVGAALGTSTTTSYIESVAGVQAGGRTGLTAVTVAVLFVLAIFLAPLARTVPEYATAPALFFVACLMARGLAEIPWEDVTEAAPAVLTALTMPFTFGIANGIAFGFICYAAVKLLAGRPRDVHPIVGVLAVLFVLKFWLVD